MPLSLLRIQAPAGLWCRRLRNALSTDRIRVDLLVPLSADRSIERIHVPHGQGARAQELLRAQHLVDDVEADEADQDNLRVRFSGCSISEVMRETGLVPRFPFHATATEDLWLIDGQVSELQQALAAFAAQSIPARVESLQGPLPDQLTPHQGSVLEEGIRLGYYDFPRRVSLTEFASERGVAKSTLSQTLMLIEKKIALRYQDGQGE